MPPKIFQNFLILAVHHVVTHEDMTLVCFELHHLRFESNSQEVADQIKCSGCIPAKVLIADE